MKLRRFYCNKKMTKLHVAGNWKKVEDNGLYVILQKKCKGCGKVLNEEIIK